MADRWRIDGSFFGAICPERGIGAALVMPYADTAAMQAHLAEISAHVAPDAHAVPVLDQAGLTKPAGTCLASVSCPTPSLSCRCQPGPRSSIRSSASAMLFAAAIVGDRDGMQRAFNKGGDLLWKDALDRSFLEASVEAQQMEAVQFIVSMRHWKPSGLLHANDTRKLIDVGLLHPEGSQMRRFAVSALTTLIVSQVISSDAINAALPPDINNAAKRFLLLNLGLPDDVISKVIPRPIPSLPPLEYSLRLEAKAGEPSADEWKELQKSLKAEGLYSGPIDGIPGTGTFDGLYAYVLGLVPLIVERSKLARKLAEEGTSGYGHIYSKTGSSQGNYIFGRILKNGTNLRATGYIVFPKTKNARDNDGYFFLFTPVPELQPSNFNPGLVGVHCSDGSATRVFATIFGDRLTIGLDESHGLRYGGVERFKNWYRMPGQAPDLGC